MLVWVSGECHGPHDGEVCDDDEKETEADDVAEMDVTKGDDVAVTDVITGDDVAGSDVTEENDVTDELSFLSISEQNQNGSQSECSR